MSLCAPPWHPERHHVTLATMSFCAPPCHPERSRRVWVRGAGHAVWMAWILRCAQNDIFRGYAMVSFHRNNGRAGVFTEITVGLGSRVHWNNDNVAAPSNRRPRCPISVIHGAHYPSSPTPIGISGGGAGHGLLDAHDAVAGVDGDDGPRYSGGQSAAEEQSGVRYLLVSHVALHRRPVGVGAAHIVETGY